MKVIITEDQLKLLINETNPLQIMDLVHASGIPVKKHSRSSGRDKTNTWSALYPNPTPTQKKKIEKYKEIYGEDMIPEIISGVGKDGTTDFDPDLIHYVKAIQNESGVPLVITGGDDLFHQKNSPSSAHGKGKAIDFVMGTMSSDGKTSKKSDDITQSKIEGAIIELIKQGIIPYDDFGLINEYKNLSNKGTGPHFHLSNSKNKRHTYFHFIDNKGNVIPNPPKSRVNMFTPKVSTNKHDMYDELYSNLRRKEWILKKSQGILPKEKEVFPPYGSLQPYVNVGKKVVNIMNRD